MKFDSDMLIRELESLPVAAWSLPSNYAVTGVHHNYCTMGIRNSGAWSASEAFPLVIREFEPIKQVSITKLMPGGFILPHTDAGPFYERWQVPIQVAGVFDDYEMQVGIPFRVEHWKIHSVWNDTDRERIHLLIDRDIKQEHFVNFQRFEDLIPPEYLDLVRNANDHVAS